MKLPLAAVLLWCTLCGSAFASSIFSVGSVVCSGTPEISIEAEAFLFCPGDFSLQGGSIFSDTKVQIRSGGALSLDNLSIAAPFVVLSAQTSVELGSGAIIDASSRSINVGSSLTLVTRPLPLTLPAGGVVSLTPGTITLAPAIPEPSIWASMLAGLGCLAALRRRRQAPF